MNLPALAGRHGWVRMLLFCLACFTMQCRNPFLPPTTTPGADIQQNDTPEGVIGQLVTAYEKRRKDLFNELLHPHFRFYVQPNYWSTLMRKNPDAPSERIDSTYHFIYYQPLHEVYYYWGLDGEKRRHEKLFSYASDMSFIPRGRLLVEMTNYITRTDSTGRIDTAFVEIVTDATARIAVTIDDGDPIEFEIGTQVFYITRSPDEPRRWVIYKWFDLGA